MTASMRRKRTPRVLSTRPVKSRDLEMGATFVVDSMSFLRGVKEILAYQPGQVGAQESCAPTSEKPRLGMFDSALDDLGRRYMLAVEAACSQLTIQDRKSTR